MLSLATTFAPLHLCEQRSAAARISSRQFPAASMATRVHAAISLPSGPGSQVLPLDTPPPQPSRDSSPLLPRLLAVFYRTWDLGFTAFGGPPVHFTILHRRFVQQSSSPNNKTATGHEPWLDEQTFQELFAVSQSLPGPASTKMLFSIALLHAGWVAALFVFALWSLPGAIVMYGLSLGVSQMGETLPGPVYALLSGLNASTVGVVALAAVQLANKAIRDRMTRVLVIWGGCAGLCYNALWYFPVLIVAGGVVCVGWDIWAERKVERIRARWRRRKADREERVEEASGDAGGQHVEGIEMTGVVGPEGQNLQRRPVSSRQSGSDKHAARAETASESDADRRQSRDRGILDTAAGTADPQFYGINISTGIGLIAITFGESLEQCSWLHAIANLALSAQQYSSP
jgi:chromate transport protein ChrA